MSSDEFDELAPLDPEILPRQSDLPTVPTAFRRTDYEGWLEETVKRFQLRKYQRTQAERITVLKQINELQTQCLALARNEANWRHYRQEDRLRKMRLDIEEVQLDFKMQDLLHEREQMLQARVAASPPRQRSNQTDLVEEIKYQLQQAIRTEAGVKDVFAKAKRENPHLEDWLSEWEAKVAWDLRERKWS